MPYSVHQLAKLADVSVRTLHYYDEVGLLTPTRDSENDYRQYSDDNLLTLQQILFFRELEFPLEEIRTILASPNFDLEVALQHHRKLLEIKRKRLNQLIRTIDKTMANYTKNTPMDDKELYDGFSKEQMEAYAEEAKQRWGNTEAYKQSMERTKHWTKDDYARLKRDGDIFMNTVASHIEEDPASEAMQELIAQHYNSLRTFYEPSLELYRGLAEMYIADERFTAYFEKYRPGLAQFMHDAMIAYCNKNESH